MRCCILSLFLLLVSPAWGEISQEDILSKVETFYSKADDLSAEFVQTTTMEGFGERVSKGKVSLKKPGMVRWDYHSPVKQQVFVSQDKILVFDPEQRQAVVQKLSAHPDAEPALGLLSNVEEWRTRYQIRLLPREKSDPAGRVQLELLPRASSQIEKIQVLADSDTGMISRLILFQEGDSRIAFEFSKILTNQGLKNGFFNYTIPKDVEVLEYP